MSPRVAPEPRTVRSDTLARERWERSDRADARLAALYAGAVAELPAAVGRTSLVAVGGYGRGEMSPASDLDVVLLHAPDVGDAAVAALADALWYPLWDDGVRLDHAVRDTETTRVVAGRDWRAALGVLDARHVAGAAALTLDLRSSVLADWRRSARERLPAVRAARQDRVDRAGDVAHATVPHLRDGRGGLRDGVLLRALVATWLVDVPHQHAEEHRTAVLDVRDALHAVSGRRVDRLHPEVLPDVAGALGTDAHTLSRQVRAHGRRTAHLAELTWRRVDQVLQRPAPAPGRPRRRPALERLGHGVARVGGEVVLDRGTRPGDDPFLAVRAAAVASERGLLLGPSTAARLAEAAGDVPNPWPDSARRLLVRLLAAGPGLVPVWEELDHTGLVARWLPEWSGVRLRPSDSPVHRFTVDRHSVETCVEASRRLRDVARPDLLVVAALLHDVGKGALGPGSVPAGRDGDDHSRLGAPLAEQVARRWGFGAADARTVATLVRHHLLLAATAVRRDLEDPATLESVVDAVRSERVLDALAVLSEADARSAGPAAWTTWRAGLVADLVARVRIRLRVGGRAGTGPTTPAVPARRPAPSWAAGVGPGGLRLQVYPFADGTRVCVAAPDRPGLLADVAGAMAVAGLRVRAARASTHGRVAVSTWDVDVDQVDPAALRQRLCRVLDGSTDVVARLARSDAAATGDASAQPARVGVLAEASGTATVLEVRAQDRPGLVWQVCRTLSDDGVDVRSAHLETWGPQVEDVVYVTDRRGHPLEPDRCEALRARLEGVLRSSAGAGGTGVRR